MRTSNLSSKIRHEALPLLAFSGVAGFWLLSFALGRGMSINAPKAEFVALLRGIDVGALFTLDYFFSISIACVAAATVAMYCLSSSRKTRIALAVGGWLLPVLFLGWPGLSTFWYPFAVTYDLFAGHAGGQFIKDGPLIIGAIGWWLLFFFALSLREAIAAFRLWRKG